MFVFPMAGQSSRFTQAGYSKPKFMLKVGDETVFDRAIGGFRRYFQDEAFCFIFIAGQVDPRLIEERCALAGIPLSRVQTVALPAPTDGQARTVAEGVRQIGVALDEPLTIFNIDTFYIDFVHPHFADRENDDGYLDVFVAEGTHWSFVEPETRDDSTGIVRRVTEKDRISDLCSTGLYHFRSAERFLKVFDEAAHLPAAQLQGGERYIAPLYQRLIDHGGTVHYRIIPAQQVAFCGTPTEYRDFLRENGLEGEEPDNLATRLG